MNWITAYNELREKPEKIKSEIINKCKMKESRFNNIIYKGVKPTELEMWIITDIVRKYGIQP